MAPDLAALPTQITAGTTVKYTASHGDYPADQGWALTLHLAGASLASVGGVPSGSSFAFTLTAAATATLKAGIHQWSEMATKGGEKYVAASGVVEVLPNIEAALAGEMQSPAEKELALVQAAIAALLEGKVASYQIAGRAVVYNDLDKLYRRQAALESRIWREKNPGKFGLPVRAAFTGAGAER